MTYLCLIISQFLQDIFDALFAIQNESSEQCGNLVFQALVSEVNWSAKHLLTGNAFH